MKKGYIQAINSAAEFQKIVKLMNDSGVKSEQITINKTFYDFAKTVVEGDYVVVYNLDCFNSIAELVDITMEFSGKGVKLESLTDLWYCISPESMPIIKGFAELVARMRTNSTLAGLTKAKAQGKKLGRPMGSGKLKSKIAEAEKLHRQSNISIAKACAIVDCNPRSYYRYCKAMQENK